MLTDIDEVTNGNICRQAACRGDGDGPKAQMGQNILRLPSAVLFLFEKMGTTADAAATAAAATAAAAHPEGRCGAARAQLGHN